jgi:hypothetical protein
MNDPDDMTLLLGYLDGALDAQTRASVERRLANDSAFQQQLARLRRRRQVIGAVFDAADLHVRIRPQVWQQIAQRTRQPRLRWPRSHLFAVFATCLAVILIGAISLLVQGPQGSLLGVLRPAQIVGPTSLASEDVCGSPPALLDGARVWVGDSQQTGGYTMPICAQLLRQGQPQPIVDAAWLAEYTDSGFVATQRAQPGGAAVFGDTALLMFELADVYPAMPVSVTVTLRSGAGGTNVYTATTQFVPPTPAGPVPPIEGAPATATAWAERPATATAMAESQLTAMAAPTIPPATETVLAQTEVARVQAELTVTAQVFPTMTAFSAQQLMTTMPQAWTPSPIPEVTPQPPAELTATAQVFPTLTAFAVQDQSRPAAPALAEPTPTPTAPGQAPQ